MRKPSEYIAKALQGVRNRLMPDCSVVLRQGEHSATVTRVGTTQRGGDALMGEGINEGVRVLASAADFPGLAKGSAVELGDSFRVVVSASTDPAGAALSISLSAEFENHPATYRGTRREGEKARTFRIPLNVLLLDGGPASNFDDAIAPTCATSYTAAVRRTDWPESSDPELGDVMEVALDGRPVVVKVSAVARHEGWFILKGISK